MPSTSTIDELLQIALFDALSPLMAAYQTGGSARLYWLVAPANTPRPYAVLQLQSDIAGNHRIGRGGYETLLTVKAVADTLTTARTLRDVLMPLSDAPYPLPALPPLTIPGFDVSVRYERSPQLPFDGSAYQVGHIFRLNFVSTP